jgi:hypothetical protein
MMSYRRMLLAMAVAVAPLVLASCGGGDGGEGGDGNTNVPHSGKIYGSSILAAEGTFSQADFDAVRSRFMFFGHQSVGQNILDGLEQLASDPRYALNVCWVSQWSELSSWCPELSHGTGGLGNNAVGANYEPETKIASFDTYMRDGGMGGKVAIALFKLCYVDIAEDTNVGTLFAAYKAEMESLESAYASTIFVYVTVPLLPSDDLSNVRHNDYNKLVRDYCTQNNKPLYDLADVESVGRNGAACSFQYGGGTYSKLCADWRGSDAHLNEDGGRRAAKAMMLMFVDILKKR